MKIITVVLILLLIGGNAMAENYELRWARITSPAYDPSTERVEYDQKTETWRIIALPTMEDLMNELKEIKEMLKKHDGYKEENGMCGMVDKWCKKHELLYGGYFTAGKMDEVKCPKCEKERLGEENDRP